MTNDSTLSERITPIVLVGGKSRRFGRDKLIEPIGDSVLVALPINVLRAVFGPCVALVGDADMSVLREGDTCIEDDYPLRGPTGGILSALEHTQGSVFVLAGDMPTVSIDLIHRILERAKEMPDADAVVAGNDAGLDPCLGLYRMGAIEELRHALSFERSPSLQKTLAAMRSECVMADMASLSNINHPRDLPLASPRLFPEM